MASQQRAGKRIAILSMFICAFLAVIKILVGLLAGSTSVVADGVESASDAIASSVVLFGLVAAARPPDANHPYGHGRLETLTGGVVGLMLAGTGIVICVRSLAHLSDLHAPPAAYAIWPLLVSIVFKGALSPVKLHYGRKVRSSALVADAWNDLVDVLSGLTALLAVGLTLYDPSRFLAADHYGGFGVGLIVVFLGLRVIWDTAMRLMDTMPDAAMVSDIRRVALSVPGVMGVEKCFARNTGYQHHVDLHLEVDPAMTVQASHDLATLVRVRIIHELEWVADVLVHVEPYPPLLESKQEGAHGEPGNRPPSG
ncbi:MAG: cation transporter [Acidobacteriales bacterium]|nr:MAG: cation transporter [Terriglobales bacterium]